MRLLQKLGEHAEILVCIYSGDIERKKIRADFGITYDVDALKLIDDLRDWNLLVSGVVINRYENQPATEIFKNKLERGGVKVYLHRFTKGYPTDIETIVSEDGYGANPAIPTTKPLVVVTGPGPGSGKLATCLSQLYHDHKRGIKSGYAKFETFPIWDLPLKHPVNTAYESATADIGDFNMIDSFHLEAYGKAVVNYNRDVEVFPVLKRILDRISKSESPYKSPTDMGVNRASIGITDNSGVIEAAKQETIRRYFRYAGEFIMGFTEKETVQRAELLMKEVGMGPEDRRVVVPARQAADDARRTEKGHKGIFCGAAIELRDGSVVTGKNSPLMHAASSLVLNAVKTLAGIPDQLPLLSENILASISSLKRNILKSKSVSLDLEETMISLSISATTNPTAKLAMDKLAELRHCEVHMTHMPSPGDEVGLKRLGVNLTADPSFASKDLFQGR
jgi:uncharacterized protein (UPF0371 family)